MRFRSRLVLPAIALSLASLSPARAGDATFAQLLARAQAEEAAGRHWAPAGDNLAETFVAMINLMSTATPDELAAFDKLLHKEQGILAAAGADAATSRRNEAAADQPGQPAVAPAPRDASPAVASAGAASPPDAPPHDAPASHLPARNLSASDLPAGGGPPDHDFAPSGGAAAATGTLDVRAAASAATIGALAVPTPSVAPSRPEPTQDDKRPAAGAPGPVAVSPKAAATSNPRWEAERPVSATDGTEADLAKPPPDLATNAALGQTPAAAAPRPASATMPREAAATRAAVGAERPIGGPQPLETASPGRVADAFGRGAAAEARCDISAARRFYTSAAQGGSAGAARALARLYDPAYLRDKTVGGIDANADIARQWNERAATLDNPQADLPTQTLSAR